MCLAGAGSTPDKKAGLGTRSRHEASKCGEELPVASREKVGQSRRLGRGELENKLFQVSDTDRNRYRSCAGGVVPPAARRLPATRVARRQSRTTCRRGAARRR